MQVLVEPTANGVRVTMGSPLTVVAEGATEEEAIARLQSLVAGRLQNGVLLTEIVLPTSNGNGQDPWLRLFGIFKDDPYFDAWQEAIEENRRRADAEEGPW